MRIPWRGAGTAFRLSTLGREAHTVIWDNPALLYHVVVVFPGVQVLAVGKGPTVCKSQNWVGSAPDLARDRRPGPSPL